MKVSIVIPSKKRLFSSLEKWFDGTKNKVHIDRNKSGFMDPKMFKAYVEKVVLPHFEQQPKQGYEPMVRYYKARLSNNAMLSFQDLIIVDGLISKTLGMDFPGEGTVYISQNSSFKRPVFVDSTVKVELKVTRVDVEKRRLVLDTTILNSDGKVCLAGSAEVWLPE